MEDNELIRTLLDEIKPHVYPTSQIFNKEITVDEYIINLAQFFLNEIFDRRMPIQTLPLIAKLAVILHETGEIKY